MGTPVSVQLHIVVMIAPIILMIAKILFVKMVEPVSMVSTNTAASVLKDLWVSFVKFKPISVSTVLAPMANVYNKEEVMHVFVILAT